jgi:hypothetical protein
VKWPARLVLGRPVADFRFPKIAAQSRHLAPSLSPGLRVPPNRPIPRRRCSTAEPDAPFVMTLFHQFDFSPPVPCSRAIALRASHDLASRSSWPLSSLLAPLNSAAVAPAGDTPASGSAFPNEQGLSESAAPGHKEQRRLSRVYKENGPSLSCLQFLITLRLSCSAKHSLGLARRKARKGRAGRLSQLRSSPGSVALKNVPRFQSVTCTVKTTAKMAFCRGVLLKHPLHAGPSHCSRR